MFDADLSNPQTHRLPGLFGAELDTLRRQKPRPWQLAGAGDFFLPKIRPSFARRPSNAVWPV
jgi:hypothetical protein